MPTKTIVKDLKQLDMEAFISGEAVFNAQTIDDAAKFLSLCSNRNDIQLPSTLSYYMFRNLWYKFKERTVYTYNTSYLSINSIENL